MNRVEKTALRRRGCRVAVTALLALTAGWIVGIPSDAEASPPRPKRNAPTPTAAGREQTMPGVQNCPADLNGDGEVDGDDLGILLELWSQPGAADLNDDGVVDFADLEILLAAWVDCTVDPCADQVCDDGDPCTIDGCDPVTGECVFLPIPGCGECGWPEGGDCGEAHETPACADVTCCEAVCDFDPYCCEVQWDAKCALYANEAFCF